MSEPVRDTTVTQGGRIVRDIEAQARAWAQIRGLPLPAMIVTDPREIAQTEYAGPRTPARAKRAFFPRGRVARELIEPLDEPSPWKDPVDRHGDSRQHLALQIQGLPHTVAYLDAQGRPLVRRGEYTGGRYANVDGTVPPGCILQLLEND